jgi:hypothetical protein
MDLQVFIVCMAYNLILLYFVAQVDLGKVISSSFSCILCIFKMPPPYILNSSLRFSQDDPHIDGEHMQWKNDTY